MRTCPALIAALLLLLSAPAGAAVVEIPLPELAGTYGLQSYTERTATFHLPSFPAAIHGASLRVRGTTEVGIIRCTPPRGDSPWVTTTSADMSPGPNQHWLSDATNPLVAGAFETVAPFEFYSFDHSPATWTFLEDGEGTISFSGAPILQLCDCVYLDPPSLTVTEVTLIIEGDFPVPIEAQSWGRIKAAYR